MPLGEQNHLRSRTAALSDPVCYTIGASEVKAYGETPFFLQANKQEVTSWRSPCNPLLPDVKIPALLRKAVLSRVWVGTTGWR